MAADTTLSVTWETREDLNDVVTELRKAKGSWTVTMDEVIRQLLADRAELHRLTDATEAGA